MQAIKWVMFSGLLAVFLTSASLAQCGAAKAKACCGAAEKPKACAEEAQCGEKAEQDEDAACHGSDASEKE